MVEADLALLPKYYSLEFFYVKIRILNVNLTARLNKFDFWMNLCSPFDFMSKEKYEDLCSKLRSDLEINDGKSRWSNQAQPVVEESSLNPNYGNKFSPFNFVGVITSLFIHRKKYSF